MRQYLDVMRQILETGNKRGDRTGTGTLSLFGLQMEFDLQKGFPLVTTKRVWFHGVAIELLWFLSGSTNIKFLKDNNVGIWNKWADDAGELGPVYGSMWRRFGATPDSIPQPKPKLKKGIKPTYLNVGNGSGCSLQHIFGKTWEGMMGRCYDSNNIMYSYYGGRGVHVCDRWLEFKSFAEDVSRLPGWENKKRDIRLYVLDKDGRGNGFVYSPESCQWITHAENASLQSKYRYKVERDGFEYEFTNSSHFCREMDIDNRNFHDLWTEPKEGKRRYGFQIVSREPIKPGVDQISRVINDIRTNPNSRRLIVSAWNPYWVDYMALPPCHSFFQFYVRDGFLDCKMYQRSADWIIGVPFNIASYALLTHMVAQVTGLKPGRFVHTFGDAHIYLNHLEQAREQLKRTPKPLSNVHLNPDVKSIFDFKRGDICLENYIHDDAIKAPIAV